MRPRLGLIASAILPLSLLLLLPSSAGATSSPGPRLQTSLRTLAAATTCDANAATAAQVALLVHGTSMTAEENWGWNYRRALPKEGWATCVVTLPDRAFGDVQVSSEYVVHAIRHVAQVARRPVDVIGISQGGLEVRWALRWWPELRHLVDDAVMIATPNHGAVFADVSCLTDCLPALWQGRTGSRLLAALNEGDETPGDVDYTVIQTRYDEVVTPYTSAFLDGATNVLLQDKCAADVSEHLTIMVDQAAVQWIQNALGRTGPADPSFTPACV